MNIQAQYLSHLIDKKQRQDGRGMDSFRPVEIIPGFIGKAEGSARVRIGKTDVIAGVKLEVGKPFADRPGEGVLIVAAELPPLASPDFEAGPPREEAIELARVVDRGIREAHAIDLEKLCITPKEKCWMVNVDLMIFNHDGNLIDAAGLAALTALKSARFPQYDGEKVNAEVKTSDTLPLAAEPVGVTVWKIGRSLVLDPTLEEERAATARLTVSTKADANICAIQKGGSEGLSWEEIEQGFGLSIRKGAELRALVEQAVKAGQAPS